MENRQLNFDVSRGGIAHRLFVRVGDTKSRTVSARMYSGSEVIPVTAAYLRAVRPDGTKIYNACAVQDSEVVYTFTTEDLACGGELECEFDLHNGESVMTSPKFIVVCEKLLYDGEGIETSDEYQAYISALLKLENLTVSAEEGAEAAVTKEDTGTGMALRFTLPVGNLDDELAKQQESLTEQETLAKEIASTLAKKKAGTSIDLGIESATVGQIAQITKVDENGAPTAWEAVDMGEKWELLCDITLEEEVNTVSQRWSPMKKVRIVANVPAASSNTSYMPVTIHTNPGNSAFNHGRFYPTALPRTNAVRKEYVAEMLKIGDDIAMRFTEYGMYYGNGIPALSDEKSTLTLGNDVYGNKFSNQYIVGMGFHTYDIFGVGTNFKVWGVKYENM